MPAAQRAPLPAWQRRPPETISPVRAQRLSRCCTRFGGELKGSADVFRREVRNRPAEFPRPSCRVGHDVGNDGSENPAGTDAPHAANPHQVQGQPATPHGPFEGLTHRPPRSSQSSIMRATGLHERDGAVPVRPSGSAVAQGLSAAFYCGRCSAAEVSPAPAACTTARRIAKSGISVQPWRPGRAGV